jgi:hypothetical protein
VNGPTKSDASHGLVGRVLVDLDADPFVPDGWQLVDHCRGGTFAWDLSKIGLYLAPEQKSGSSVLGYELLEILRQGPHVPFNANLVDFILANTHLIPDPEIFCFSCAWGTRYKNRDGQECVRGLHYGPQEKVARGWAPLGRLLCYRWYCTSPSLIWLS